LSSSPIAACGEPGHHYTNKVIGANFPQPLLVVEVTSDSKSSPSDTNIDRKPVADNLPQSSQPSSQEDKRKSKESQGSEAS